MFFGQRLTTLTRVALVALLAAACSDAPTAPAVGRLNLGVHTSGGDIDIDGYEFVVDSLAPRYVSTSGVAALPDGTQQVGLTLLGVKPGAHVVSLNNVADNCTVGDANPRSVTIAAGEAASVQFSVVCVATGVAITTHTTGLDQPLFYDTRVDSISRPMPPNDSQFVSRLEPGPHTISLQALPANCSLPGGAQTVTVAIRTTTPVHFEIACTPIVRLEKIAYTFDSTVVGRGTQRMVGLRNPDGSGASALAVGDAPSWSPDGRRLVLTEALCTPSYYGIYYGYSCAGGLVIVDPEMGSRTSVAGVSAAFSPAWSPTGDLIAFTRCCESADRNTIYFAKPDGSLSGQLTISQVVTAGDPGWSPDGKRIVFTCSSGNANDLCVIDRDGSGFARLTTNIPVLAGGRPAWKPDGTSIAFTADARGGAAISLLDLASGAVTRVTGGSQPAWSRDGSRLVFSGVDTPGLYTVNVDGSVVERVATGAYGAPAWRP
jgi:hypothetical protein